MIVGRAVRQFTHEYFGPGMRLEIVPLRGGLETEDIARAVVYSGGRQAGSFVVKQLPETGRRELEVYRLLQSTEQNQLSPKLLGSKLADDGRGYMFLEWVSTQRRWPWNDLTCSSLVVERLAHLHGLDPAPFRAALAWDYERELLESAHCTLTIYREAFLAGIRPGGRPMLSAIRRLVAVLPRLHRELLSFGGACFLHGDAHPGNVILKASTASNRAFLLDWGRARIGSPLEDLSSWVHSVSLWEEEARRKHDTLLSRYCVARGIGTMRLSRDFRDACFLAGACNAMAGALRYHMAVLQDGGRTNREKSNSYRAAADWLRIVRRADECLAVQGA